ncbi:ComE operon protein 2 [Texcoconibacillus texcoconensis]|uniref:ComE operon protein 2 n=1 Tax=Texcoconibacillus texcoconensis TaxID=1095777 RepID=A0A840QRH4_9BACI|nr:ComE operon protein 2 [Texcoconibacillus texcoconensis]MBB5173964.1 dCMP deaminase [Texcoconibacillus texcoconensis]
MEGKKVERISWHQYFMAQSHLLSLRSTCTRLMVGATIVRDKRIIAGGYNGSISGGDHCIDKGCYVVEGHCVRTVHAEVNALLQCAKFGVPTQGSEIYVTHFPCLNCCKAIIQAGISKVVYAEDYKNDPFALELFHEAGVETEKVELEEMLLDQNSGEKLRFTAGLLHRLEELGLNEKDLANLKDEANRLFTNS